MKKTCASLIAVMSCLLLSGCSTTDNSVVDSAKHPMPSSTQASTPAKKSDPTSVKLITKPIPHAHYSALGHVNVPIYNTAGVKRQQGVINDLLVAHAAEMGGNAVIVNKNRFANVGEIIQLPS